MTFVFATLWHERRRYLAGVFAVAFSAVLIAMQVGMLLGLIGAVAIPIVNSNADIWVMYPNTAACDLGRPIPNYWIDRLWMNDQIQRADQFIQGFTYWKTNKGSNELIVVLGVNIDDGSLGPVAQLTPELRRLLTEPGAVVLDRRDAKRLEVEEVGQLGEVNGRTVRVCGFTKNMPSISGAFVITSLPTARSMLRMRDDQTTYLLAKCRENADVPTVVRQLRSMPNFSVHDSEEWATNSKMHWMKKTKAGIALGFAAVLGLAVGASVTSQTLYAAVTASLRELAVLSALGIPRLRMATFVMQQSVIVGLLGLAVALPGVLGLSALARSLGARPELPAWLWIGTSSITVVMVILSGLLALRSLRGVQPATLLR